MENDEIGQVVRLEIQGIEMLIKAPVQVAALIGRAIRAIIVYSNARYERELQQLQTKEQISSIKAKQILENTYGKFEYTELAKICDGMPMSVSPNKEYLDTLKLAAGKMGLHFAEGFDFDTTDNRIPLFIPPQEKATWDTLINGFEKKMNEQYAKLAKEYESQAAERREKAQGCKDEAEKAKYNNEAEAFDTARSELLDAIEDSESKPYAVDFQTYLSGAENTEFEKNPERVVEAALRGETISKKFEAEMCFQTYRSDINIPESRLYYYLPDTGRIVKREFTQDVSTKLWSSKYTINLDNGEKFELSDKNIPDNEWNSKYRSQLYDKAGCLENTMCYVFQTEEALKAHIERTKNPQPTQVEERVKKKYLSGEKMFSSPQVEHEVLHAIDSNKKLDEFRELNDTSKYTITCDTNRLTQVEGKLRYKLSDNEYIEFSAVVGNPTMINGKGTFTVDESCKPTYVNTDNVELKLRGLNVEEEKTPLNIKELRKLVDNRMGKQMDNIIHRQNGHRR